MTSTHNCAYVYAVSHMYIHIQACTWAFRANAATFFFRLCRPAFRLCRGKHDLTVRKKNDYLRLEFGSVDRQGHGHGHHTKRFHNGGKFELPECVTCRRRTAMPTPAPKADRAALDVTEVCALCARTHARNHAPIHKGYWSSH